MAPERSLEEIIREQEFAHPLEAQARTFFKLCNRLAAQPNGVWTAPQFYQLAWQSQLLETFLDDHGAKFNRAYSLFRELIASVRWHANAAFSVAHLEGRFDSYGLRSAFSRDEVDAGARSLATVRRGCQASIEAIVEQLRVETAQLKIAWPLDPLPDEHITGAGVRIRLPRNMGQQEVTDENQRIAEVASKFIAAAQMLGDLGIRRVNHADERRKRLAAICTEAQARVYEATVHNLQSTFDTYVKNTLAESRDDRLPRLRGHVSGALHLLEAVTHLTHFVERHERNGRREPADHRIAELVDRSVVQDHILNHLLHWANEFMQRGRALAEEVLPAYINMQELDIELADDVKLHARPAALIVNIVGRYGTPVELEVNGHRCNAGSILDLLVAIGSNPEARHFKFRGDISPLRDIARLFEVGLGEGGIEQLPVELQYLRGG